MSISDGTTTVNSADIDATIGADGEVTISFTGAIAMSLKVVGNSAFTNDDIGTDIGTAGLTVITAAGSGSANFRVGANGGDDIAVAFDDMQASAIGSGGVDDIADRVTAGTAAGAFVDSVTNADALLVIIDDAIVDVSSQRAKLGAAQNQVETAVASLGVAVENLAASESRIRDADIAEVSTELVTRQIMQQAGITVLAQANTSAQSVLSLLQ